MRLTKAQNDDARSWLLDCCINEDQTDATNNLSREEVELAVEKYFENGLIGFLATYSIDDLGMTKELIVEAKDWLLDWALTSDEANRISHMSDAEIIKELNRSFCRGVAGFIYLYKEVA